MRTLRTIGLPAAILGIGILCIVGSLRGTGLASSSGDPLAPLPAKLDDMLEQALRTNPEILVQDAKLREAQAMLNQTRLAVTQEVVRLHFARKQQREVIRQHQAERARVDQLYQAGSASENEKRILEIAIAEKEGELARVEAQLRYAIGSGGSATLRASLPEESPPRAARPVAPPAEVPFEVARILDGETIQVSFDAMPMPEVLDFLGSVSGINFLLDPDLDRDESVTLNLRKPVTIRQALHAITDLTDISFAVREYGILAVYSGDHPPGSAVVPPYVED